MQNGNWMADQSISTEQNVNIFYLELAKENEPFDWNDTL